MGVFIFCVIIMVLAVEESLGAERSAQVIILKIIIGVDPVEANFTLSGPMAATADDHADSQQQQH